MAERTPEAREPVPADVLAKAAPIAAEANYMKRLMARAERAERERDHLAARLRGTEQAGRELLNTAEGLLGDRERAMESDRHRIRADDAEARVAEHEFRWEKMRAALAEHERVRREVEEERNRWIRLFNRLEAAVSRHFSAKSGFADDADDALHAAHAKVLKAAGDGA